MRTHSNIQYIHAILHVLSSYHIFALVLFYMHTHPILHDSYLILHTRSCYPRSYMCTLPIQHETHTIIIGTYLIQYMCSPFPSSYTCTQTISYMTFTQSYICARPIVHDIHPILHALSLSYMRTHPILHYISPHVQHVLSPYPTQYLILHKHQSYLYELKPLLRTHTRVRSYLDTHSIWTFTLS